MESKSHIDDYFAQKFFYFGKVEAYFQMFTNATTRKLSENFPVACARAQHVIVGMPVAMNTRKTLA